MSELAIAVARMRGQGTPAHQVWLPPLDVPETMDSLMTDLTVVPGLGLVSPSWRERGRLRAPLGVIDLPLEQKRELLQVLYKIFCKRKLFVRFLIHEVIHTTIAI